jgi:hypothetical protein
MQQLQFIYFFYSSSLLNAVATTEFQKIDSRCRRATHTQTHFSSSILGDTQTLHPSPCHIYVYIIYIYTHTHRERELGIY